MLFRQADLDGIATGAIMLAFRRWDAPRVKAGSRLRTRVGVVEVDEVARVEDASDEEAARAGAASRAAVVDGFPRRNHLPLWRVRLHLAGPDPRVALRSRVDLTAMDVAELGREMHPFKIDVRKVKELGLTESLDVGYRLSPRGTAYLGFDRGFRPPD